ncbi:MAG: carboxypeptidase-like regulatory domain-containing protein [Candidatus Pacebacteria bacterium]|nr:carboxypeptidase-like regulatory domain-containing protein [Candidatus Paceibacterota bacterium]
MITAAIIAFYGCGKKDNPVSTDDSNEKLGGVEVTVSDYTNAPLAAAKVYTIPATKIDSTNLSGIAILKDIPVGDYRVLADKAGYETSEIQVGVKGDETKKVNLALKLKLSTNISLNYLKVFEGRDPAIGKSIVETNDGGYLIAGELGLFGGHIYLIKVDAEGNELWNKTYGNGEVNFVQTTSDGGFIVTGQVEKPNSTFDYDILLLKVNQNGDEVWRKAFDIFSTDDGTCVKQTPEGEYVVATSARAIIRTDGQGNEIWKRSFDYSGSVAWKYIEVTKKNDLIATGTVSNDEIVLTKLDSNGNELWFKKFGSFGASWAGAVRETRDGGYLVTGTTNITDTHLPIKDWKGDVYLLKTDLQGNKFWEKTFSKATRLEGGRAVEETRDGGFLIASDTYGSSTDFTDIWIIKTDDLGNLKADKTFGRNRDDACYDMRITKSGSAIVTGWSRSQDNKNEIMLLKVDLQ